MPFKDAHMQSKITVQLGNLFCLYTMNFLEEPLEKVFSR
jgi:hypothetical protein